MFSPLIALALLAQAEPAQPAAEEPQTEQTEEQQTEEKRICRRINTGMGSRKKERVCMTREQWREFNRGN